MPGAEALGAESAGGSAVGAGHISLAEIMIVLELLSLSEWKELGLPPNFDTCARDTYPPDAAFATDHALRTLRGVAAAAAHLHVHGLTHGDLYAHNVMARASDGEAKLGDFGAAYTYRGGAFTGAHAAALERIEVRAFGCLVEEIAARLVPGVEDDTGNLADALGSIARLAHRALPGGLHPRRGGAGRAPARRGRRRSTRLG